MEMELLHSWNHVDYDWTSFPFTKEEAVQAGMYNPEHVTVTGVKQWNNTLYVTTPRWLTGVPSTLNTVVMIDDVSVLKPWPTYEDQVIGDSSKLQYIQSMETDRRGRMWIIDIGRINLLESNASAYSGAPKLWIWDIEGNKLIHEFVFPDHIASHTTSMLNDIFVDDVKDVAYISDTSGTGGIIVYDLGADAARRWDNHPSLSFEEPLADYTVEGLDFNQIGPLPVDGLALVPHVDRIFYTALHGLTLYSVSAAVLRDFTSTDSEISNSVLDHGVKRSQCDGLTTSEDGQLFLSMVKFNAVDSFDVKTLPKTMGEYNVETAPLVSADERLYWPDTFGWANDEEGGLLVSSARLPQLFLGTWPADRVNTALFRIPNKKRSYQHALGPLPTLPAAANV